MMQEPGAEFNIKYLKNPLIEKIIEGKFVGQGIRKTPAYNTPLTKADLDKWRNEFWGKFNLN